MEGVPHRWHSNLSQWVFAGTSDRHLYFLERLKNGGIVLPTDEKRPHFLCDQGMEKLLGEEVGFMKSGDGGMPFELFAAPRDEQFLPDVILASTPVSEDTMPLGMRSAR